MQEGTMEEEPLPHFRNIIINACSNVDFLSASCPAQLPTPVKPLDLPTMQARVHEGHSQESSDPPFSRASPFFCSSLAPEAQIGSYFCPLVLVLEFQFLG